MGDSAEDQRFIETLPNGYRFVKSIAVLPIRNLSGDPTQEFFSDSLTDELITQLAKNSTFRVV